MSSVPTDTKRAEAIRLLESGLSPAEIARQPGFARSNVYRWCAEWRGQQELERKREKLAKRGARRARKKRALHSEKLVYFRKPGAGARGKKAVQAAFLRGDFCAARSGVASEPVRWKLDERDHPVKEFFLSLDDTAWAAMEECLGDASPAHQAMAFEEADRQARFASDRVLKQTREPGLNARGVNAQARNRLLDDFYSIYDVFCVDKTFTGKAARQVRNDTRAEFGRIFLVATVAALESKSTGRSLRTLKLDEMRTSASSWAVRKMWPKDPKEYALTVGRALNVGRELRDGAALLYQRIAEWMHARADEEDGMSVAESRALDRGLRQEYARRDAVLRKMAKRDEVREGYEVYDPLDRTQAELHQVSDRIRELEKRLSQRTVARYRFRREHPEERKLHEKHHRKGTTVAVARRYARRYRVLAEELAARGISLDERTG